LRGVSKGEGHRRGLHPSRRLLRKLLRMRNWRHCERSEAIQNLSAVGLWIASELTLLAMTEEGPLSPPPPRIHGDRHQRALGDRGCKPRLLAHVERGGRELLDDRGEPRHAKIAQRDLDHRFA